MDNAQPTYTQFIQTKEDKHRALNDFQSLRAHPAWILLTRILDVDIGQIEKQILDNENLSPEETRELKLHRQDYIMFRDLPMIIVTDIMNDGKSEEALKADPYGDPIA